jgi:plastocyanin
VVHRRLIAAIVAVLAIALALAGPALGANRRIAIGHYQWSSPLINLDLGEHITWYWVGPDTMHSVTGTSANDEGIDSDKGNDFPHHDLGSSFQVTFNTPGTYTFQCKLHSIVRGTVVVSDNPGDPSTEPDPVPPNNVDLSPPYMDGLRLASPTFGKAGTRLHFGLDERGSVDAEIYRLTGPKHRRRFAGWQRWKTYVGLNDVRFANSTKHFQPRPGRYVAEIRATDRSNNTTRPQRVSFTIR